ncbi:Peptidyl-prolyl cis-trans isomerase D [Providencia rustigianii]|uniref:Periplasmic chaperone PpiD n=2 Tax=Providencia rustigianii TaxID=158850 RepID=D1P686_9GAMM|nr:peptidylprolyl isomerase [Providencia rustigianii]EFB71209.1 PPIC-type PPIASE domain protein [Providencia rustigianii DSM 4541]SPY76636.1 Peptidyl-prolyl cis-trans isomerase D [Providencia rustigianii]SUC25864.1 Peptidyl-prolyl cis-trans isomerase D [Providencia rustigianii]SUC34591.1 Peptidyl-prolyl cis-trans isomerase D [Providencia rustigianii]
MMEDLRTKANSPFIKVLLAIIILSFVLTGVAGYVIGGSSNDAAEVNGQPISREQLQQAFQQERQSLQEYLGDKFAEVASNDEYMKELRTQALNNLINTQLINQYANELNLSASDKQIEQAIFAMQIFQTDGKFDSEKYREILSRYNINADSFAAQIRQDLVRAQLGKSFTGTEFALPSEVKAYAELFMQQREVRTAMLPLAEVQAKQTVTEEELKAYYDANQNSFISPEQVQVSYVEMDAASMPKATVNDEEITTYYQQNLKNFTKAEQKLYSMIQVASEKDAQALETELKNGADFAALAAEKSTDKFSASNKGVIGWMEAASTPSEIISANLTEKGQVSAPIKVQDNYVLFRLDDITPEAIKPLDEVKDSIKTSLTQDKSIKQFYDLQQKVSEAATNDNESLASVESVSGLKVSNTEWFDRKNPPEALNFPKVINEIFSERLIDKNGATGINSDVINVEGDRAFVVRVTQYKAEMTEPFDQVKSEIATLVKRQKAFTQLKADGDKLITELKAGKGDEALKAAGTQFGSVQTVSFIAPATDVTDVAMKMTPPIDGKPTYSIAYDKQDNLLVVQLDKVTLGQPTAEELSQLGSQYQAMMSSVVNESLMQNLRANAKIEIQNIE